jgi:uncharacterized membrane protein
MKSFSNNKKDVAVSVQSGTFYKGMHIMQRKGNIMDKRVTGIVAYITWIGLLIALCVGDREGAKFHLNQALVIALFSLLSMIPCVGWIWGVFILICWIMGLIAAINEEEKRVPLIGNITLIK